MEIKLEWNGTYMNTQHFSSLTMEILLPAQALRSATLYTANPVPFHYA
jgi:hypothetical protein